MGSQSANPNSIRSVIPKFQLVKKRPKNIILLIDRSLKSKTYFITVEKVIRIFVI
jgi:hypothetical protein